MMNDGKRMKGDDDMASLWVKLIEGSVLISI